jgi:hypothetical protein
MAKEVGTVWKVDNSTFFKQNDDHVLGVRLHIDEYTHDAMIMRKQVDHIDLMESKMNQEVEEADQSDFTRILHETKTDLFKSEKPITKW